MRFIVPLVVLVAAGHVMHHVSAAPVQRVERPAITALVGGTLIDGYGGRPIRNSVILVEWERITAWGRCARSTSPRAPR